MSMAFSRVSFGRPLPVFWSRGRRGVTKLERCSEYKHFTQFTAHPPGINPAANNVFEWPLSRFYDQIPAHGQIITVTFGEGHSHFGFLDGVEVHFHWDRGGPVVGEEGVESLVQVQEEAHLRRGRLWNTWNSLRPGPICIPGNGTYLRCRRRSPFHWGPPASSYSPGSAS